MAVDSNEIQGWISACADERYLRVLIKACREQIERLGKNPDARLDLPDGPDDPKRVPYVRKAGDKL